jgi:carbon monoxide dehydrogenase subunit G
MELNGEQLVPMDPASVWAGLNDPDVLKAAIPGCEEIVKVGDDEYTLVLLAAVGPVKARFKGKLLLSNIRPPESYTLTFEGAGGAAGFGKGGADVLLIAVEEGTWLKYRANAQVGGKIAQVGSRLIEGVAAKMAAEFFVRFKAALLAVEASTAPSQASSGEILGEPGAQTNAAENGWRSWKIWGKSS